MNDNNPFKRQISEILHKILLQSAENIGSYWSIHAFIKQNCEKSGMHKNFLKPIRYVGSIGIAEHYALFFSDFLFAYLIRKDMLLKPEKCLCGLLEQIVTSCSILLDYRKRMSNISTRLENFLDSKLESIVEKPKHYDDELVHDVVIYLLK